MSTLPEVVNESQPLLLGKVNGAAFAHSESYWKRLTSIVVHLFPISLVAFGGPQAHLGLIHERFVERLQWLDESRFLEMIALSAALPGPSSAKVVTAIGVFRAGPLGGFLATFLWVLPGFTVMALAGIGAQQYLGGGLPTWMIGLAPAATSLVVIASVKLWQKACSGDNVKMTIATLSASIVLATDKVVGSWIFPVLMISGGLTTLVAPVFIKSRSSSTRAAETAQYVRDLSMPTWASVLIFVLWGSSLAILSYYKSIDKLGRGALGLFYAFFRMGSIIFGGGAVMLPMLLTDIVNAGWVTKEQFFIGFALIQSAPGPLFNMSAYLGAVALGLPGALLAAAGLYGPGVGLLLAVLPIWERVRTIHHLRVFMSGVNSAAIGLVVAAIALLWQQAIHNHANAIVCFSTGVLVSLFNVPSPVGVLMGAALGYVLFLLNIAQASYCHI